MNFTEENLFYRQGYTLAIANAKRLFQVSGLAAKKRNYGVANSLNILAAEEGIKALVLLMRRALPDIEDFDKIFHNHSFKHDYLLKMFNLRDGLLEGLEEANKPLDKIKSYSKEKRKQIKKDLKHYYWVQKKVKSQRKIKYDYLHFVKWWETINDQKNNGFYVNKLGNTWTNPASIKKVSYNKGLEHSRWVIDMAEMMFEIMNETIRLHGKSNATTGDGRSATNNGRPPHSLGRPKG